MELVPCVRCHRHVRDREAVCPFCASALPVQVPQRAFPRGRLTRAAIFSAAALVACESKQSSPAPAPAPAPARGSQGSGDDLEKMLDVDQHVVDHPAPVDAAASADAATTIAAAVDAGVPADAGIDQQALNRRKAEQELRRRREERDRQRMLEQERELDQQQKVMQTIHEQAKPYGAPPARRRVV